MLARTATALMAALALAAASAPAGALAGPASGAQVAAGTVDGTLAWHDRVNCIAQGAAEVTLVPAEEDVWRAELSLATNCVGLDDVCEGPLDEMSCQLAGTLTLEPVEDEDAYEATLEDPGFPGALTGTLDAVDA